MTSPFSILPVVSWTNNGNKLGWEDPASQYSGHEQAKGLVHNHCSLPSFDMEVLEWNQEPDIMATWYDRLLGGCEFDTSALKDNGYYMYHLL